MTCVVCAWPARYGFDDAGRRDLRCTRHALFYPRIRHRALRVAVVVGAVLFAINQLDVVLYGELTAFVAAKIGLTFTVPYAVSTYSALQINRLRQASSA